MRSIIQDKKECLITKQKYCLHKHHCFEGTANREKSEKWGLWVWLRADWHTQARYGVHNNPTLSSGLKDYCQRQFELLYGHNVWMQEFGKSYLLDKPLFNNLKDFQRYGKELMYESNR